MQRFIWLWTVCFVAFLLSGIPSTARADESIVLTGKIDTAFDHLQDVGLTVTVNGVAARTSRPGEYTVVLPVAAYYQIRIEGESIFTTVQSFGIAEIRDTACSCLSVPPIEIVARKAGRIELFFAGDTMAGRRYSDPIWQERRLVDPANPYFDLVNLLKPMRPYLETADLASVNLEAVLAEQDLGVSPPKSVVFFSPPALAQALADAGVDYVSLGNNHSYDYLDAGLKTTIAAVESAGLAWSGAGYSEKQAVQAARLDVSAHPVSMLGFVGWKGRVTPNQIAEQHKGGAAYGSSKNIRKIVQQERNAGRLPIVQLHGSREYSDRPTDINESRMRAAIDAGAILVASHHPHVTQGIEIYKDGLIAYSLGNFLFDQYFMLTQSSFALKVWVEDGKVIRAEVIPLRILDYRPVPAVGTARRNIIERVTRLSAERGTHFYRTGGHLAVRPGHMTQQKGASVDDGHPVISPESKPRKLVYWGDFENSRYGDARDRTLQAVGATIAYRFSGLEGSYLELQPEDGVQRIKLQPNTFFRKPGNGSIEITGKIKTGQSVRIYALIQNRPKGVSRLTALETAPFASGASGKIMANEAWQKFVLRIPGSGKGDEPPTPFRVALEFEAVGGQAMSHDPVRLDDLIISQ